MRPHDFWQQDGFPASLLAPLGALTAAATARRLARPGWRAPIPVICIGNATVGGAGKTTVALDLGARLTARGIALHFLSRGYGGRERGPLLVDMARHDARTVGDEPLLLAAIAPAWIAADREAGARSAVAAGAEVLLLDDGLQNPSLHKDLSLLVIDAATGFGNGRLLPAGPLREPVAAAAGRCAAAVLIGEGTRPLDHLPPALPVLRARLEPDDTARDLAGRRVFAFAGIAHPAKFHATLRGLGAELAGHADFPDHHPYSVLDLERILARARAYHAVPVTTAKDAVRVTPDIRAMLTVVGIRLAWHDPSAIEAVLRRGLP
ncbi:MAG TPA: tetraacyldisaccharide 4'-kinase [Acetobacteraceae bacterium]|nr:tetraacyldisaccharide 4'-kinase [Acetobacteraceae bacterium]